MARRASARTLLLGVFGLSGCSGLIYESLWTHYLKLFLGHAAYAQTLVLAIFMGGMAVGAWLCSRYSPRWQNLLRGYALTEAVVGVLAMVFHPIYAASVEFGYADVIPNLPSMASVTFFKWVMGSALILPQSVLLGMTFPLMAGGFVRRFPHEAGRSLATLYFSNSLGGVFGVLLGGFVLVPWLGLPMTGIVAGGLNLVIAAMAWTVGSTEGAGHSIERASSVPTSSVPVVRVLLLTALFTGTASFIYEIGWIRMLSLVLGSSTHSFELMLSAFILGLALGGWWIRTRIDRTADPVSLLGHVQVAMGILAVATLPLYPWSFIAVRTLMNALRKDDVGYWIFHIASHGIALALMLPATFLAGMTLPLITAILVRRGHGEKSIGAVYGANTVGAILGIMAAVHVGFPLVGLKGLLMSGAVIDAGLGVVLLSCAAGASRVVTWRAAAVALGFLSLMAVGDQFDPRLMATGVFRQSQAIIGRREDVVFSRDGKTASVTVTRQGGALAIRTNGKVDATVQMGDGVPPSRDEPTQILAGALPVLLNPTARSAANIGFGSGVTSHVLLASPLMERVDTIEIEPAIVEGARLFGRHNQRVYTDPRSRIVIDDAKTFFVVQRTPYDVIVSEPSNPWVSGTASLFTSEFYRLIRRHLTDGGVFVQWLQLYEFDTNLVGSVLKALGTEFDDYAVYAVSKGDLLIVATNGRPVPDLTDDAASEPGRRELDYVGFHSIEDVRSRRVATRRILEPWLDSLPIDRNSDYRPVLDDGAARARFLERNAVDIARFGAGRLPLLAMLGDKASPGDVATLSKHDFFPYSPEPFVALELRRMLAAPVVDSRNAAYSWPSGLKSPDALSLELLESCRTAGSPAEATAALLQLGRAIAAFLPPAQVAMMWDRAESLECVRAGGSRSHDLVRLFRAIGARNGAAMGHAAAILMDSGPLDDADRAYVVAAGMLGHLAIGEREAARDVWKTAQPLQVPADLKLTLAVLLAHAEK